MARSSSTSDHPAAFGSTRVLQIALVVAAIASLFVVLGLFGTGFRVFCLAVIVVATFVTEPARRQRGGGWWYLLLGAMLGSIVGAILAAAVAETVGGLLALVSGLLVISAAAVGFPSEEE
jgi:drug/metabolite transporter (DMT)-like permease